MKKYFVVANSHAAPFCSDTSYKHMEGETPEGVLVAFAANYKHPCGLYAAVAYASADAYHKGDDPLARWLCNLEIAKIAATKGLSCYSYRNNGGGSFEIDGTEFTVEDYKGGVVVND